MNKIRNNRLSVKKIFEPEVAVGLKEVDALVAVIAMHAVRIDHKVELLAFFMESVN